MSKSISDFKRWWQQQVDRLGDYWALVIQYTFYVVAGWYTLMAICAPFSEYCWIGGKEKTQTLMFTFTDASDGVTQEFFQYLPLHRFYKMWQKLLFMFGFASLAVGLYKLGTSFKTSNQRKGLY